MAKKQARKSEAALPVSPSDQPDGAGHNATTPEPEDPGPAPACGIFAAIFPHNIPVGLTGHLERTFRTETTEKDGYTDKGWGWEIWETERGVLQFKHPSYGSFVWVGSGYVLVFQDAVSKPEAKVLDVGDASGHGATLGSAHPNGQAAQASATHEARQKEAVAATLFDD